MLNNDYMRGFNDGFAKGYEEAKRENSKKLVPRKEEKGEENFDIHKWLDQYNKKRRASAVCQVCGVSGIMGYVCSNPNCPSRITYTSL